MTTQLSYTLCKNGRFSFAQHKQYSDCYYTYYSKRGYFVACTLKGAYGNIRKIEARGETEKEAIENLKTLVNARLDKMKKLLLRLIAENEDIIRN